MMSLSKLIMTHIQSLPEGGLVSADSFIHAGHRAAINKALARLCKTKRLLRIAPGIYTAPVMNRFGIRAPAPENIIHAWSALKGEVIVSHGAISANLLGLTTQVPIREIFLTAGRSKKLILGKSEVIIKHAPYWMMHLGTCPASDAVRAIAWMGQEHASKSLRLLYRILSISEWEKLEEARHLLPSWMKDAITKKINTRQTIPHKNKKPAKIADFQDPQS